LKLILDLDSLKFLCVIVLSRLKSQSLEQGRNASR